MASCFKRLTNIDGLIYAGTVTVPICNKEEALSKDSLDERSVAVFENMLSYLIKDPSCVAGYKILDGDEKRSYLKTTRTNPRIECIVAEVYVQPVSK